MAEESVYQRWRSSPKDQDAFGEWYTSLYPTLIDAAFRVSGADRDAAEDLVQDAIIKFASSRAQDRIERDGDATAYLIRSVYNAWIDTLRRRNREIATAECIEQLDLNSPAEILAAEQKLATIQKALKPDDLTILAMMIAGETLPMIAKLANLSYTAAGVRVHRIRKIISKL